MYIALATVILFLLFVTLLPILRNQHYLIRSCDFVRLQVFYLALPCGYGTIYWWLHSGNWYALVFMILVLVILSVQGFWIYPYTWFAKTEVQGSSANAAHSIRIISANVLMSNHNSERLLALVKQYKPDLLVTLETNSWWENKLSVLKSDYPHYVECAKENRYGMHVYSKFEIVNSQVCELIEDDIPSIHILFKSADGILMQAHFIHPAPPSPTEEDSSRPRDSELIIVAQALKNPKRPVIVAGDLNDVAWSRTTRLFMQISGFLDPRKGRGFFNTFHAKLFFMRWPLDHLFHSEGFKVKKIKRLAKYGSDHFALLTELTYEHAKQQSLETKSEEDIEQDINELVTASADKKQVPKF